MDEFRFTLQPSIYMVPMGGGSDLATLLEGMWDAAPASAILYVASGFVDQNGVLPFVRLFKEHAASGGRIRCFFGGSSSQNMAGRQAVEELLSAGADVSLLNRKKIFHVKMYGVSSDAGQEVVLSSGNFTGNGLALNVESSVAVGSTHLSSSGFSWRIWEERIRSSFEWYSLSLANRTDPGWRLTYDETHGRLGGQDEESGDDISEALVFTLSPIDTQRILSSSYPGTQYFWLSRYTAGYFPPLLPRSRPTAKRTFSTDIEVDFRDLSVKKQVSVTFEAYNNLDFRLGTGPLRRSGIAKPGDVVVLDRIGDREYRMKILEQRSAVSQRLLPYLVNFIGHKGKRYGFVPKKMVAPIF
jgi:hypothetical protein